MARAPGPLGSTLSALRDATISLELDHAFTVAGELANPNPNPNPNPSPNHKRTAYTGEHAPPLTLTLTITPTR